MKINSIAISAIEITTTSTADTTLATKAQETKTSAVQIWAPIVAIAGAVTVCLLIFFGVRQSRRKADLKKENQLDYEVPYAETKYEQPYRYSDEHETQNDAKNLNNDEIYEVYHSDLGTMCRKQNQK